MAKLNFENLIQLKGAPWCFKKLNEFKNLVGKNILDASQLDGWLASQYLIDRAEEQSSAGQSPMFAPDDWRVIRPGRSWMTSIVIEEYEGL